MDKESELFKRCLRAAKFELEGQPLQQWSDETKNYVEGYIDLPRLVKTILNEAAR